MRQLERRFPETLSLTYVDINEPPGQIPEELVSWAKQHIDLLPALCIDDRIVLSGRFTSRKLIELVRQHLEKTST